MLNTQKIMEFYFASMLSGWVSDNTKEGIKFIPLNITYFPCYNFFEFGKGNLRLVDGYYSNKNTGQSMGTTTIWEDDIPIWIMQYGGFHQKQVITFLKSVIRETYEAKSFQGGRGPEIRASNDKDHKFVYTNSLSINLFEEFQGVEEIIDQKTGKLLACYHYFGMTLI